MFDKKEFDKQQAFRMKNWEDITNEEKIERLREIVKILQNRTQGINRILDKVDIGFRSHSHLNDKLVVEYDKGNFGGGEVCGSQKQAQNYF